MAQDLTGLLGGALLPAAQPITPTSAQDYTRIMQEANKGFSQAVGGMFGVDTRTTPEFVQEEVAKLNPESVEDQAKIVELVGKINPAGAVALKSAFAKKAAEKDILTAQTTAKTEQAEAIAQGLETTYPQLAASIRLGNPDALKKGVDILGSTDTADRYKVVGNNVFDVVNEKFVESPDNNKEHDIKETWSEEKQANVIQWTEKGNPNIVVKELLAAKDIATQSVFIGKQIKETTEAARAAAIKAASADSIAKRFEETNPVGGIFSTAEEATKAFLGLQDETSSLKIEANRLITGNAVQNLPRGPASDKDIALVLAGEPPANANWETMASYARGIAKMQRAEQEYFEDKALWFDMYGNETGFATFKQKQVVDEELAGIFGQIPTQATGSDGRVINLRQDLLNNLDDPVEISKVQDALNKANYDINFQELLNKKNKLEKIMQSTNRKGF
jgi:hypothetical protein